MNNHEQNRRDKLANARTETMKAAELVGEAIDEHERMFKGEQAIQPEFSWRQHAELLTRERSVASRLWKIADKIERYQEGRIY